MPTQSTLHKPRNQLKATNREYLAKFISIAKDFFFPFSGNPTQESVNQ